MILTPEDPRQFEFSCRFDEVSEEPLVRCVDDVVRRLDLAELYSRYSDLGRPYYDCSMMLKVLFFGYCDGVRSSRSLSRHIRYDVRYRYFCGSLRPDFRTINRFRQMNLDLLSRYFAQIVLECAESGLLDVSELALDGTKIRASASGRRKGKKRSADDLAAGFRAKLAEDIAADGSDEDSDDTDGSSEVGTDEEAVKPAISDPDSRYMKTSEGGRRLSYNSQVVVDRNQVIVASDVSNNADDSVQFKSMMDQSMKMLDGGVDKVLADGGYYSGSNLKYAADAGIDLYLPVPRTGNVPDERFHQDSFVYDEERDSYTCPAGERLKYLRSRRRKGKYIRVYGRSRSVCGSCEFRKSCTKARVRRLEISEYYRYEHEMKAKLATEKGGSAYDRRKQLVEPVFGNIKFNLGYVRFSLRTLAKVRGEFLLMCIAHNLRKLAMHWAGFSHVCAVKTALRLAKTLMWTFFEDLQDSIGLRLDICAPSTN
jgi:transposase